MEDMLAGNIRMFRKQRRMTQEQLAEALGVTVGAVYKWEAKLSTPELKLIMQLADLFDVSVDALLGYRMQDNRPESIVERLYGYCQTLDPAAPAEAEKALSRYPNSLQVVYTCANIYLTYGFGQNNPDYSRRSLELLEQARILLPQSDNSEISEETILGTIADVYLQLGEREKAVEILKKHNTGGRFCHVIGSTLAVFMNRTEEAVPFLSEAMARGMICLINSTFVKNNRTLGIPVPGRLEFRAGCHQAGKHSGRRPDAGRRPRFHGKDLCGDPAGPGIYSGQSGPSGRIPGIPPDGSGTGGAV